MISSFFKWPLFERSPAGTITKEQVDAVIAAYVDQCTGAPLLIFDGSASGHTLTPNVSLSAVGTNNLKHESSTLDHGERSIASDVVGMRMKRLSSGPASPVILWGAFTINGSTGFKYIAGPQTTEQDVFVEVVVNYTLKQVTIFYNDINVYHDTFTSGNLSTIFGTISAATDGTGATIGRWYDRTFASGDATIYGECYHVVDYKDDTITTGRLGPCDVENTSYEDPIYGTDLGMSIVGSDLTSKAAVASLKNTLGDSGAINILSSGLRTSSMIGYLSPTTTKVFDKNTEIIAVGVAGTATRGNLTQASSVDVLIRKEKASVVATMVTSPCKSSPAGIPMAVCDLVTTGSIVPGDGTSSIVKNEFDVGFRTGKIE